MSTTKKANCIYSIGRVLWEWEHRGVGYWEAWEGAQGGEMDLTCALKVRQVAFDFCLLLNFQVVVQSSLHTSPCKKKNTINVYYWLKLCFERTLASFVVGAHPVAYRKHSPALMGRGL